MVSILDFIKTGKLGFISLGVSIEDVTNILGNPNDVSVSRKPRILRYGSLQLAFSWDNEERKEGLSSIHVYFDDENPFFPQNLCLEGWIPDHGVNKELFFKNAVEFGICFKNENNSILENRQISYISDANVVIVFSIEDEKCSLESIHMMNHY